MKKLIIILISIFTITINLYSQKFTSISYCKCDTIHLIKDTSNLSLIIYTPVHCKLGLTALRPDSNQTNILFTAPAAFTTKNYKEVVGRFVGIDTIIENPTENETGLCSINNKDVYILQIVRILFL